MHISQINHTIRRSILLESFSSVANDLNMIIILTSDFLFFNSGKHLVVSEHNDDSAKDVNCE